LDRIEQRVFADLATVAAGPRVGRLSEPATPVAGHWPPPCGGGSDGSFLAAGISPGDVRLSAALDAELRELDAFLFTNLYRHPMLVAADEQARRILSDVFRALVASPSLLPARFQKRVADQGVHRVVADYVAGMTDRFCLEAHAKLCG
jgi:dGTP triphosphohydrolase